MCVRERDRERERERTMRECSIRNIIFTILSILSCVIPIVPCVYMVLSCVNAILTCLNPFLSCINAFGFSVNLEKKFGSLNNCKETRSVYCSIATTGGLWNFALIAKSDLNIKQMNSKQLAWYTPYQDAF